MSHNPLLLLCDAACKLPCLQNNRNAIVQLLNDRIADSVPRGSDTRSDVLAILQTAAQYPDGLAELREIVGFFDAGKTVFNEFTLRLDRYLIELGSAGHPQPAAEPATGDASIPIPAPSPSVNNKRAHPLFPVLV